MTHHTRYDPATLEDRWQKKWEAEKVFAATVDPARPKYYVLEMLPYPSGRLHMGHVRNYSIGDVLARYKWMQGYNVLHPMGWDAFGMPAENAAIKNGGHPHTWTVENIATMKAQLKKLGFSYDWSREMATCEPEYYRWEQWLFLELYKKGFVFRKNSIINWCPNCQTVLANEQVENGLCWRCDAQVVQKPMTQWFFRLPEYAASLLKDVDALTGWPDRVRSMQREWIGESHGASAVFDADGCAITIFTTRPDTLFGVSFVSLALTHPLVEKIVSDPKILAEAKAMADRQSKLDHTARLTGQFEKEGLFTGRYARHPLTGERIPIYLANFVLMDYGTGAVMAVPAHDQRDFEFAKKYKLPITVVIQPKDQTLVASTMTEAYTEDGVMVASGDFTGMDNRAAGEKIAQALKKAGRGEPTTTYKLRDWCISRQRYWGTPIPIVYCDACGVVPEKNLPVILPKDVQITGEGGSPLAKLQSFVNTACPMCGKPARRETDTMDTFIESSWYFLRYCSPHYDQGMADPKEAQYWMPIDQYIGGIEHAVGHLLYCRLFMKLLRDLKILQFSKTNEPAVNLMTQGMVYKDGAKMSKSKGNVVDPDDMIATYGADTARLFVLFASPPELDLAWSDQGVEGCFRFLSRVWRLVVESPSSLGEGRGEAAASRDSLQLMHHTIQKVTDDIERMHYNTAIAAMMEYLNHLQKIPVADRQLIRTLVLLLSPFAPHMCEELWSILGEKTFIAQAPWPKVDPQYLVRDTVCVVVQVNGKVRDKLQVPAGISEEEIRTLAKSAPKVQPHLEGKTITKVVVVPGRLVSFVVQ